MVTPLRRLPTAVRAWTQESGQPLGIGISIALHTLIALSLLFVGRESTRAPAVLPVIIAELVQEELPAVAPALGEDAAKPAESIRANPVKGRAAAATTEAAQPSLGALLAMVERAHRPEPVRAQAAHDTADAIADIGGGENDIARGSVGNTPLKDFIRAQIARRWQVDTLHLGEREIVVSLRLLLNGDGSLEKVEIVEKALEMTDPLYRAVALAGRNAALLSAPLQLPVGIKGNQMDITLDLSTKDAGR